MANGDASRADADRSASTTALPRQNTSLLVRALWFVFVGWWLTGIWLAVAWFLLITIVGAPLGIVLINRIPFVLSLKRRDVRTQIVTEGDETTTETTRPEQSSILLRAVYFLLVGWWLSLLWTTVAYAFTVSIIGLPIAIWMFGKLPYVVSLYRY
ncbi:hypothetical protein L593_14010 [Salinarchaeum sp. Harcht-Bsk1]|uniref:YccF domain-containing protein n=1 Tax=Salinarchaeum sp. Harcht-Bsk1 TaxID=1333523 RepID=UPI00034230E3|nr:YccF domain-containing protein [Salinarchaeum sp. Harcht-Bsk1]AGN02741.1 hypothetical protein L593_14010 [Salinarchaeum sp. Harcht-Bsk1]